MNKRNIIKLLLMSALFIVIACGGGASNEDGAPVTSTLAISPDTVEVTDGSAGDVHTQDFFITVKDTATGIPLKDVDLRISFVWAAPDGRFNTLYYDVSPCGGNLSYTGVGGFTTGETIQMLNNPTINAVIISEDTTNDILYIGGQNGNFTAGTILGQTSLVTATIAGDSTYSAETPLAQLTDDGTPVDSPMHATTDEYGSYHLRFQFLSGLIDTDGDCVKDTAVEWSASIQVTSGSKYASADFSVEAPSE